MKTLSIAIGLGLEITGYGLGLIHPEIGSCFMRASEPVFGFLVDVLER